MRFISNFKKKKLFPSNIRHLAQFSALHLSTDFFYTTKLSIKMCIYHRLTIFKETIYDKSTICISQKKVLIEKFSKSTNKKYPDVSLRKCRETEK